MSMGNLLMFYIRLAVQEAALARVPNQLVTADSGSKDDENKDSDVNEFCGVGGGGIVGFSGPLGAGSTAYGKKKRKRRK